MNPIPQMRKSGLLRRQLRILYKLTDTDYARVSFSFNLCKYIVNKHTCTYIHAHINTYTHIRTYKTNYDKALKQI